MERKGVNKRDCFVNVIMGCLVEKINLLSDYSQSVPVIPICCNCLMQAGLMMFDTCSNFNIVTRNNHIYWKHR